MPDIKILAIILAFYSISTADGVKCYQCKQGDPTCFISPPSNGNVIDCKPEQNGCYIIYYLDGWIPRHFSGCSVVPEETPEDERLCYYEYNQGNQLVGSKETGRTIYPKSTSTTPPTTTTTPDDDNSRCYCRQDLCNYL